MLLLTVFDQNSHNRKRSMGLTLAMSEIECHINKGKLPGLVVKVEDYNPEPWSLDVGLNPGFISLKTISWNNKTSSLT